MHDARIPCLDSPKLRKLNMGHCGLLAFLAKNFVEKILFIQPDLP